MLNIWTIFNIDNKKCFWAPNQPICMISEGSRDSEDAENTALHHRNKLILQSKTVVFIVIIFHNITVPTVFLCFFDHMNAALVRIRHFLQKQKIVQMINFWMVVYRNSLQQQNECAWFSADNSVLGNVWVHTNIVEFFFNSKGDMWDYWLLFPPAKHLRSRRLQWSNIVL